MAADITDVDFCSQSQKFSKSKYLGLIVSTSGANARHSLNQDSWNCFLSTSVTEPGHHQIWTSWTDFVDFWNNARKNAMKIPGTDFLDFCNEGQKIIKSGLLGLILPTSGANTRKASNQDSWDGFLYFCSQTRTSCNPDFWD